MSRTGNNNREREDNFNEEPERLFSFSENRNSNVPDADLKVVIIDMTSKPYN